MGVLAHELARLPLGEFYQHLVDLNPVRAGLLQAGSVKERFRLAPSAIVAAIAKMGESSSFSDKCPALFHK